MNVAVLFSGQCQWGKAGKFFDRFPFVAFVYFVFKKKRPKY
jgi:hypothetical protein